jgi:predicted  nucleic acid-binding Zn-ribbon protein
MITLNKLTLSQVVNTIEIDFGCKKLTETKIKRIMPDELYQIKVKGINQNLYKVSINTKDSTLSKSLKTPLFGEFNLEALSSAIAGLSSFSSSIAKIDSENALRPDQKNAKIKSNKFPILLVPDEEVISRMRLEGDFYSDKRLELELIVNSISTLNLDIQKQRLKSNHLENKCDGITSDSALDLIEKVIKDIQNLKITIIDRRNTYEMFSRKEIQKIALDTNLIAIDKSIKDAYDKFILTIGSLRETMNAEKVYEVISLLTTIENNSSNEYLSLPFQLQGEQATIKLTITPREEKSLLQSFQTQLVFPHSVKDYNVIGISFYGSNLRDNAYSTVETIINDSTSFYNLKAESGNRTEIGIAALLRHGIKLNEANNFGVHFSLGTGVSISNKIKPRILVGAGTSFGRKHMLAIDFGGAIGYADRLSSIYIGKADIPKKPENFVVSKLSTGLFGSIGYIFQF